MAEGERQTSRHEPQGKKNPQVKRGKTQGNIRARHTAPGAGRGFQDAGPQRAEAAEKSKGQIIG